MPLLALHASTPPLLVPHVFKLVASLTSIRICMPVTLVVQVESLYCRITTVLTVTPVAKHVQVQPPTALHVSPI